MIFLVVVAAYVVAMALIGGAVLARYMLPAVPLVIIVGVSTLRRRLRYWLAAVAVVAVAFVAAWFWNPPYGFSPEDNLAYRDYILLHQDGERFLEARYPMAHVLTAWPASDELTRPWLGYITRPVQVVRIEDFSLEEVLSAAEFRSHFRGRAGVLDEIRACASAAGSLEGLGGLEAQILRLPSRFAAGGSGADSRRARCVFRRAQGAVDRRD